MTGISNRITPDGLDELIGAARQEAAEFAGADDAPSDSGPPGYGSRWRPPAPESFRGYQIVREIHRGGQGIVYQAVHEASDRDVAIKVLRDGPLATPRELGRFEREVSILREFEHPNVVTVLDVGAASGQPFVVMPYVEGRPLDAYVAERGLDLRETLELFAVVCDAVNAAHLRGVIHRDIKPSNIRVDDDGRPHVLDFGLAKLCGTGFQPVEQVCGTGLQPVGAGIGDGITMTESGQFIGSLPWSSPEQAAGRQHDVDVRSDVYSLGVVLYRLLTGRFPYDTTGSMRDVLDRIIDAAPTRPRTVSRRIDTDVETIILKCLCKERQRRYQSAGELATDVHRYLEGEAIGARRDSAAYVAWKFARRHRTPVTLAVSLVLAIAAGGITSAVLWRKAVGEYRRAEQEHRVAEERAESLKENANVLLEFLDLTMRAADARERLSPAIDSLRELADRFPELRPRIFDKLARVYRDLGAYDDALTTNAQAVAALEKLHGVNSVELSWSLALGAQIALSARRNSIATELSSRLLAITEAHYGPHSIQYANVCAQASRTAHAVGATADEDAYAATALALAREQLSRLHMSDDEAIGGKTLAEFLHDEIGADLEAEQLQRTALEAVRRKGTDMLDAQERAAHYEHSFAILLRDMGRLDEAAQLAREALAHRRAAIRPGEWFDFYIYVSAGNLGIILARQGRHAEAEPLLQEAYGGLRHHPDPKMRAYEAEAANFLAELYDKWDSAEPGRGFAEKAEHWRAVRVAPAIAGEAAGGGAGSDEPASASVDDGLVP